ncbi:MAG: imidazole glycerol phosphate synthase subunit HisH [Desulfovibrionaceae bacterium]|nr:imidazole glycerol phosphate synthase subunit HisH [Desulfovibrionaceae bacterium]
MLGIVDYQAGNHTSVARALRALDIPCVITNEPAKLQACVGLIFPGVGAAGQAMATLQSSGMAQTLKELVQSQVPLLGICLGAQILLEYSAENDTKLLGLVKGECRKFAQGLTQEDGSKRPIPHMGYNQLNFVADCPLFAKIAPEACYYFVHSYYMQPSKELIIATTNYGETFCSVYGRNGLWGLQFHPEKSGRPGLSILKNFYNYCQEISHAQ